jgi:hypothetical protein
MANRKAGAYGVSRTDIDMNDRKAGAKVISRTDQRQEAGANNGKAELK